MPRRTFQMPVAGLRLSRAAVTAVCTLPLLPLLCGAEPLRGASSTTGQIRVTLVVLPVFNVLEVTRVKDGYEYRIWTNRKSVVIGGREYRFSKVGEATLKVDGREGDLDNQLNFDRSQGLAQRSGMRASAATAAGSVSSHSDDAGRAATLQKLPTADRQIDIHTVTVTY